MLRNMSGNTNLLEFEIKVSLSDLKHDCQKAKWQYNSGILYYSEISNYLRNGYNIPHYFYYVVPEDIVSKAEPIIRTQYLKAGLYSFDGNKFTNHVRAVRLHNNPVREGLYTTLLNALFARYTKLLKEKSWA